MAQDFRAIITGQADLSKAKQDFETFKKSMEQPIKITVDASGFNAVWGNIQKQAQQSGIQIGQALSSAINKNVKNVKVNLPLERLFKESGATSIASHLGIDTSTAQALKNELKNINAEGATLSKLTIGNNGKSFEAIVRNANTAVTVLGRLEEEENQLGVTTSRWITSTQKYTTDFTAGMRQAQQEADKLSQNLDKVSQSFITGQFDANISKMEQGLMGISDNVSSDLVKKASDAAAEYYRITQEISNSLANPNQQGALQGQQLADAYKQAEVSLKTYNNAMTEVRANTQKMLAEGVGARNANQVETWAKNNSKALKQYGDQLQDLATKMRGAQTQGELNGYVNQFKNLKAEITAAGLGGKSFGDQLKNAFVHIGEFTGIYAITSQMRQLPQEMVQEVIKIDTAMTELRKVSTASASEISDYFDMATESARKYGQTVDEIIDATASWTRLGYNLEDATELSRVSALLGQVGSGLDVESASSGLQAVIKGFNGAAQEAEHYGDIINYIADTQPLNAQDIIEGLTRSASSMAAAGNTLEQTIGLIAAGTSVTQDSKSVAQALKTISMRLRGSKTELEAAGEDTEGMATSVSKLREEMLALSGVDIMVDDSTFKETYDVIDELSYKWQSLTDIQQASITELIAGKRNGNVLNAILSQMSIARETVADANTEAVGSMESQLSVYNESIQASLDKFKVAFQELSYDFINSDTIKGLVDFGTVFLRILDELIEHIGVLGTALTGLGVAKIFSTAVNGAKNVSDLSTAFSLFFDAIKGGSGKLEAFNLLLGEVGAGATGAGSAIGGLLSTLGGFIASPAGLVTGVVAAVAAAGAIAYNIRKKQQEELRKQATEATEKWTNDKSSIDEYKAQYTELNDQLKNANLTESERIGIKQQLLDLQNQINEKYGADVSNLDLINGKYETQLNLISQIAEKEAHRSLQDNRDAYQQSIDEMTKDRDYTMYSNGSNSNLMKQIEWAYIRSGFKDQGDLSFKFTGDVSEADESIRTLMDRLEALKATASDTEKEFLDNVIGSASKMLAKNNEILNANQANYKAYLEQSLYDEGYGDELATYSKLVQEYNDALAGDDVAYAYKKRSEMLEYYRDNIEDTFKGTQYEDFFTGVTEQIDTTSEKMMDWRDIVDDETTYATNKFSKYADLIRKTVGNIKNLELDGVDIQAILGNPQHFMYGDISQLARLWDEDIDLSDTSQLQSFADFLMSVSYGADAFSDEVDLAKSSFEDFMKSASTSIDTIDKVNSALVNSFKSGGLSARIDDETGKLTGDVQTILDAYKGADVSQVFEKTADGVIVNRDALRELQSEQEKTLKEEFGDRIAEAYDKWKEAISNKDLDAIDYWKEQYDNVRLLATAYDGATSAYQKWLDAQEMGEAGDMYDTVTSTALKRGQELYEQGLVGTNEFRAIAQLYSNEDLSTASIDELTAAYESGYQVVKKYFTDGQDGAQAFADKIVELGYATKDAEDNYEFFNGIDTQKVANDLGISVDLVEAAFKKLGDYGFNINFDFNTPEEALTQFESRLTQLNNKEVKPGVTVDIHNDEQLREIAEYILNLNDEEINAEFNISGTETVDEVIDKLKEHYEVEATVTTDTSNVKEPQNTTASVNYTTGNVEGVGAQTAVANYTTGTVAPIENQTAKVDYTTASVAPIENQTAKIDYSTSSVEKIPNQRTGIDYYTGSVESIPDQNATANYTVSVSGLSALPPDGEHRDIYIDVHTNQRYKGTVSRSAFQGMSRSSDVVSGTSHARGMLGKVGLKHDESALINELGAEIVVRPSEDSWMIFNNGMPTFASLQKDDVVFNAELTKKLLQTGKADEYAKILGSSHANGTIKGNAHATVRGGGRFKRNTSSGGGGNGGNGGNGRGSNNGGSGNKGSNNNKSSDDAKTTKNTLDEVEILISRIERQISNLDKTIGKTYLSWSTRNKSILSNLKKVRIEIKDQNKAYDTYIKKAKSVDIPTKWKKVIQSGKFNIAEIVEKISKEDSNQDKDTLWDKIQAYKEWYEKALAAKDAIQDLTTKEAELYKQRFDNEKTYFEQRISETESAISVLNTFNERLTEGGRLGSKFLIGKELGKERTKLAQLNKEYSSLVEKRDDAVKNGNVITGSEMWYDMTASINDVGQAIAETEKNIVSLNKNMKELDWDRWDAIHDAINGVSNELEFLYNLIDEDKMFDDTGKITNQGVTAFALLAQEYDTYLSEAQRYQEEINSTQEALNNDKYNQNLVDKLMELKKSQQDVISNAEKVKDAMIDVTKNGIKKQIDYIKDLIDEYEDLLDKQKSQNDYAKNISNQQKELRKLEKQYKAISNDNSEEGAARRQKLNAQIEDKRQDIQNTQNDRRISETKEMLSSFEESFEEFLNNKLNNVEAIVMDVITTSNNNRGIIKTTIETLSKSYGYTPSDTLKNALSDMSTNLVGYFDSNGQFDNPKVTTIADGVTAILNYFKNAQKDSEDIAKGNKKDPQLENPEPKTTAKTPAKTTSKATSTASKSTTPTVAEAKTNVKAMQEIVKEAEHALKVTQDNLKVAEKKKNKEAINNALKGVSNASVKLNTANQNLAKATETLAKAESATQTKANTKTSASKSKANTTTATKSVTPTAQKAAQDKAKVEAAKAKAEAANMAAKIKQSGTHIQSYKNSAGKTVQGYFKDDGTLDAKHTGWAKKGNKIYRFENGKLVTNKWITVSGKKYYVDSTGARVTGKQTINKTKYTFDNNGVYKKKGWRRGTSSVPKTDLAWTNENGKSEAIIRKSDGAILTPLSKGDSVIPNSAMKNMYQALTNPAKYLKQYAMLDNASNSQPNVINMQFIANGVQDPNKFANELMNNKKIEKWIQEITLGQANGNNSYRKYSYAIR